MFGWPAPSFPGLYTQTQNMLQPSVGHFTTHRSTYNNGAGRVQFSVDSYLPVSNAETNSRALEFSALPNDQFLRVLGGVGMGGGIALPYDGLGEYIYNPQTFPTAPNFFESWARYFLSQLTFPQQPYL